MYSPKDLSTLFPTTCWVMNVCELTLAILTSPWSRAGTTGRGAWRMLWWVREWSRPLSPSQLWVTGSLSSYDVIIYFVQNSYYIVKMWHSFIYHESSYVWDLILTHLVIMLAPGSWCPRNPGVTEVVSKECWL
jgi:hypothetical protein